MNLSPPTIATTTNTLLPLPPPAAVVTSSITALNGKKAPKATKNAWDALSGASHVQSWNTAPVQKRSAKRNTSDLDDGDTSEVADNVDEEEIDFCALIDLLEPVQQYRKGGHPRDQLLDKLLQRCAKVSKPAKTLWWCRGIECGHTFSSCAKTGATRHAKDCSKLTEDL